MSVAVRQSIYRGREPIIILSRVESVSIHLLTVEGDRFPIDMHLQKLDFKSVEMRNMRNKVHKVGELESKVRKIRETPSWKTKM